MFKKYKWNFVSIVFLIALIGFFIFDLVFYRNIKNYFFEESFNELRVKTQLAVKLLEYEKFNPFAANQNEIVAMSKELRHVVGARVTFIDLMGKVIADSDVLPEQIQFMENHITRPEVQQAATFGWGQSYRGSATVKNKLFYSAFLLNEKNTSLGYLRFSYYAQKFEQSMNKIKMLIFGANLLGVGIFFLIALFSGTIMTRPITHMIKTAKELNEGKFEPLFLMNRKDEFGYISILLNDVMKKICSQMKEISSEHLRMDQIMQNLDVGVIVVSQHGEILYTNPAVFRILSLEHDQINQQNIMELVRCEELTKSINLSLERGIKTMGEIISIPATKKKHIKYFISPFLSDKQKTTGILIQLTDITEMKKLEAVRRDFVSNASHELKTPLTAIIGYADTLLEGAAEKPEARIKFLRKISEQGQRLEFLVSDLLKLAELEREKPLFLKSSSLVPLVRDVVEEFSKQIRDKKLELKIIGPDNIAVKIDEEGMRTVFNNLIDNAIKYTPEKGRIEIAITPQKDSTVLISVSDTGPGIDPKFRKRIFQRFCRIDDDRSRVMGGTGLGLAIVKHIIEKHGSKIFAENNQAGGSRFYFLLR